ncbi:MAG TPA: hypothetical protein VJ733_13075 [Candidatus Binatia bacterium]|nr:hypothetical protein [Candidatus Binatia bacterium]
MAFTYKGYRWTVLDVLSAVAVVAVLGYLAVSELVKLGISLASVAGIIWGFGTLLFMFLYPFPIYGRSVEGEKIMEEALKERRALTRLEFETIWGRGYRSKINPKTVKLFVVFFVLSGGLTLLGIVTNT